MPFNVAIFKTRALSAIVFALIMLAGLLWNKWGFIILFTIIHFGCWFEFVKLMRRICGPMYLPYGLFGLVYITMPMLMMISLGLRIHEGTLVEGNIIIADHRSFYYRWVIPCSIVFSIWINDTMAYIIGSLIGKTPFSSISPKKTWEGTTGGAVLCVAVMALIGWWSKLLSIHQCIMIASICAIFGTLGDLLESKLKRMANVKDSGTMMPGHGGFLDRFDSLLTATPFVWLYVYFFIR
jgi:phosphatidate cytidylyltransferase